MSASLVGSEMCIRDRGAARWFWTAGADSLRGPDGQVYELRCNGQQQRVKGAHQPAPAPEQHVDR
eukprot:9430675-Alexandrium_andersonii.AAC.1